MRVFAQHRQRVRVIFVFERSTIQSGGVRVFLFCRGVGVCAGAAPGVDVEHWRAVPFAHE